MFCIFGIWIIINKPKDNNFFKIEFGGWPRPRTQKPNFLFLNFWNFWNLGFRVPESISVTQRPLVTEMPSGMRRAGRQTQATIF